MKESFREQVKRVSAHNRKLEDAESEVANLRQLLDEERAATSRLVGEVDELQARLGEGTDAAEAVELHRAFMAEARLALAESTFGRIFTRAKAKVSPKVFR